MPWKRGRGSFRLALVFENSVTRNRSWLFGSKLRKRSPAPFTFVCRTETGEVAENAIYCSVTCIDSLTDKVGHEALSAAVGVAVIVKPVAPISAEYV